MGPTTERNALVSGILVYIFIDNLFIGSSV